MFKKCSYKGQAQSGGAVGWCGTPVNFYNVGVRLVGSIRTEIPCGPKGEGVA